MIGNRLSPLVLKELIRQHNIASCRYYIFKKSEHKQIKAVCTNKQCEYVCRASRPAKSPPETLYKVTALKDHNCQLEDETTYTPPPPSSKYLASLSYIQEKISQNPSSKCSDLAVDLKEHVKVTVKKHMIKAMRRLCREQLFGSFEDNFNQLSSYLELLKSHNPGTVTALDLDEGQFQRFFIAFGGTICGYNYCRPLVQVDGTHLHNKYKQVLLTSSTVDAQGQLFPLGFAVVSGENLDNWVWFFEQFQSCFGNNVVTFVSDREKGLLEAVRRVYPEAAHSYCLRHLAKNVGVRFSSLIWKAAKAESEDDLNNILTEIRSESSKAYEKLVSAGLEHWTSVHFPGLRYGHLTSNLIESLNAWLLNVRGMPIVRMVNAIAEKLSLWFEKRFKEASDMKGTVSDKVFQKVKSLLSEAWQYECTVVERSEDTFVKVTNDVRSFVVDVNNRSCSCQKWQLTGYPCSHGIAALLKLKRNIASGVDSYYYSENYKRTYGEGILPIDLSITLASVTILPPEVKTGRGRPRIRRYKPGESQKRKESS
ncbi:hypothetical protein GEMRC1_002409 [Eukaryota sp. GEM-RC1]